MSRPKGPGRRRDMTSGPGASSTTGHFWDVARTTPGKQGGRAGGGPGGGKPIGGDGCAVLILGALGAIGVAGAEIVRWLS